MLPSPTAKERQERMNSILLPQTPRSSSSPPVMLMLLSSSARLTVILISVASASSLTSCRRERRWVERVRSFPPLLTSRMGIVAWYIMVRLVPFPYAWVSQRLYSFICTLPNYFSLTLFPILSFLPIPTAVHVFVIVKLVPMLSYFLMPELTVVFILSPF